MVLLCLFSSVLQHSCIMVARTRQEATCSWTNVRHRAIVSLSLPKYYSSVDVAQVCISSFGSCRNLKLSRRTVAESRLSLQIVNFVPLNDKSPIAARALSHFRKATISSSPSWKPRFVPHLILECLGEKTFSKNMTRFSREGEKCILKPHERHHLLFSWSSKPWVACLGLSGEFWASGGYFTDLILPHPESPPLS